MSKQHGVILLGANGSGKSTLGRELARALNYAHFDVEDYWFYKTDIPYTAIRPQEERNEMLLSDMKKHGSFVVSGDISGWGEEFLKMFDLAVFLAAPAEIRIKRIENREYARWGVRICEGGDMHELQKKFYEKVSTRDVGLLEQKALEFSCPLLRIDSTEAMKEIVDEILTYINQHSRGEMNMLNLEVVGQGATTKIYRDGNTAIKLYVNASSDEVDNEVKRQRFAWSAGLPVPAVYGVRKLNDSAVALDMEYIDGQPLMQSGMDKDERKNAINVLVMLQCEVHKVHAGGLPKLTDILTWKIQTSQYLDEPQKSNLISLLTQLNYDSDNLCHGDFHPLNILYDGSKHWIIDWVDASAGNPFADACRTYLIFKQHLSRSAGIYLRAFCKETNSKQEDVLAWLPIIAAARLKENMDDKSRLWLLTVVQEWDRTRRPECESI